MPLRTNQKILKWVFLWILGPLDKINDPKINADRGFRGYMFLHRDGGDNEMRMMSVTVAKLRTRTRDRVWASLGYA